MIVTTPVWVRDEFSEGGRIALALQADGKIIVGGTVSGSGGGDFGLLRFNADGSPDTAFGTNGLVKTDIVFGANANENRLRDIAVQSDGKILAVGDALSAEGGLVRYNPDGQLDASFGTGGKVLRKGEALALQPDGRIVVAGNPGYYRLDRDLFEDPWFVYRLNANGSPDTAFGTNGQVSTAFVTNREAFARDVLVQPDGKIVVGGYTSAGSAEDRKVSAIARYNPDGSLDTSFDSDGLLTTDAGGYNEISRLALQTDGKIVAAGTKNLYTGTDDFLVMRYQTTGALDPTFDTDGITSTDFAGRRDWANGVALQADGKIVAAGLVTTPGTGRDFGLARYLADGQLDSTFGVSGKVTSAHGGPPPHTLAPLSSSPTARLWRAASRAASSSWCATTRTVRPTHRSA